MLLSAPAEIVVYILCYQPDYMSNDHTAQLYRLEHMIMRMYFTEKQVHNTSGNVHFHSAHIFTCPCCSPKEPLKSGYHRQVTLPPPPQTTTKQ